ncbi:hypothetical protein LA76x_0390 [Lysobacter antibioticus]|uniref:Uncharacterized protein n=1 Tax=Lysobacter antibioticus TaxID=84531 RepID=A0A0S2F4U0_LYSAN|nr:hypothetical protein LA76x_0390 [Lysobacter antibioticus]
MAVSSGETPGCPTLAGRIVLRPERRLRRIGIVTVAAPSLV